MLSYIIASVIGYAIGSLPTAYLLVKWKHRIDIRNAGSGNVGTLNSYEVTGSKVLGIAVLVIDVLKGIFAVMFIQTFMGNAFWLAGCAALGAVLGHNFPIWLNFQGGRGLATAAGSMALLGWLLIALWGVVWLLGKKIFQDVNMGNTLATITLPLTVFILPSRFLSHVAPDNVQLGDFKLFVILLALIILSRLIGPVREYLAKKGVV